MGNRVIAAACRECRSGHMQPTNVFLFTDRAGMPLCVPDFPAWVCDLCGLREYDHLALSELEVMLGSNHPARREKRRGRIVNDHEVGGRDAESGPRPKS
jgi:YgiT-type zinc finger domain-containing protein